MIAAFLLAPTLLAQAHTVELYRGATLAGQTMRYWAVEDTTLDARQSDKSLGGNYTLQGGDNRTILIRFGDLNRAVGPGAKVVKASLHFSRESDAKAQLSFVGRVLAPWGEGPLIARSVVTPKEAKEATPQWAATWKSRRSGAGSIGWQQAGAQGPQDVEPVSTARLVAGEGEDVSIEGLEGAIQQMIDRPLDNQGFAIRFDRDAEFSSSQSHRGKPRLVLEVESATPASGADLSVTLIERSPEYDRMSAGADGAKHWPSEGEQVTYTAHIKNVGNAPASGFVARWSVRERQGSSFEVPKALAPGEETTVQTTESFPKDPLDHRRYPIGLRIEPKGPDACAANDGLTVQQHALSIGVTVPQSTYDAFKANANYLGSRSFEDWIQAHAEAMNEFVFPQSRFSFALDGALERVRVQRISIGDAKPAGTKNDAEILVSGSPNAAVLDASVLRAIAEQLGLPKMSAMTFPAGSATVLGTPMTRGSSDLFAGLTGGGDTRFEGNLPGRIWLGYEPYPNPLVDPMELEGTDLLSATEVAELNSSVGRRRGLPSTTLLDQPTTVLLKLLDTNSRPIEGAELAFFQVDDGRIPDSPTFTLIAPAGGTTLLSSRPADGILDASGKPMRPNPFGPLKPDGSNGLYLIRATVNGETEWTWLKAWQLADAYHRGVTSAAFVELRFNAPSAPLDREGNLAKGRIVTDATDSLPAKLAPLVDGDSSTSVELTGAWVDIDLGRDRAIGEIRIVSDSPSVAPAFEIHCYPTGGQPGETTVWTREQSWPWSFANRSDAEPGGTRSIAYRGQATRARFVRIVSKSGPIGKIAEIKVTPLKATGQAAR